MSTAAVINATRHELARRVNGGLEVTLFWDTEDGTSVEVQHPAIDEAISFNVAPDRALDAFHHPFAHLRWYPR